MTVDLRSDTVTRPTPQMRAAMAAAEVGDDVYGEDPTVNALQEEFADLLGQPEALYVPSGTMANQLALMVLTRPGDAVIAGARQHMVAYEDGAGPRNAGVTWLTLDDATGVLDPDAVRMAAEGAAHHLPSPTLVTLENSHMAAGGRVWSPSDLDAVVAVARSHGMKVHLDGARLWHAAAARQLTPAAVAGPVTTVMCCLSKGLGAPVGSVLAGPSDVIEEARRARHRLGGAWRQAGILAAAGLVGLRTMRERLVDDHRRAARLAEVVADTWPDAGLDPASVETNIVTFAHVDPDGLLAHLGEHGILAGTIAPGVVRLVTHNDVDDEGMERAVVAIGKAPV